MTWAQTVAEVKNDRYLKEIRKLRLKVLKLETARKRMICNSCKKMFRVGCLEPTQIMELVALMRQSVRPEALYNHRGVQIHVDDGFIMFEADSRSGKIKKITINKEWKIPRSALVEGHYKVKR